MECAATRANVVPRAVKPSARPLNQQDSRQSRESKTTARTHLVVTHVVVAVIDTLSIRPLAHRGRHSLDVHLPIHQHRDWPVSQAPLSRLEVDRLSGELARVLIR